MVGGLGFDPYQVRSMVDKYVNALLAVEKKPIDILKTEEERLRKIKDALGELKSLYKSMLDVAKSLADPVLGAWRKKTASVSDSSVVDVTVGSTAPEGAWEIKVLRLASAHNVVTKQFDVAGTDLSSYAGKYIKMTFNFRDGSSEDVVINLTSLDSSATDEDILRKIAEEINLNSTRIRAAAVHIDSDHMRLSISAKEVGEQKAIDSITAEESTDGADYSSSNIVADLSIDDLTRIFDPTDSSVGGSVAPDGVSGSSFDYSWLNLDAVVNGIPISRSANTLTDVIPGATVSLKAIGSATVTIRSDYSDVVKKMEEFVQKFIDLNAKVRAYTFSGSEKVERGILANDLSIRLSLYDLRSLLMDPITVDTPNGPKVFTGESLGFSFDKEGNISFDPTIIQNMLSGSPEDAEAVIKAFTQKVEDGAPEDGIFVRIQKKLQAYLDVSGIFDTKSKTIDERIAYIERRIKSLQQLLSAKEEMYRERLGNFLAIRQTLMLQYSKVAQTFGLPQM